MATAKLSTLVTSLGRRLPEPDGPTVSDGELLGRFLAGRDESAFAAIVRRHGPTVYGVCRRVSGDHHRAEDAFQAVFMVLAAKADSVRPRSALAAWLYGVAYRTALRARTMADRRRRREAPVATLPECAGPQTDPADADLVALMDEEVARLPEQYRVAVVLCELEGRSRKEAATELGIVEGTLSSRLAAARKALAGRLRKRGVALSAVGLTAALGQIASANVPAGLTARAVAAALTPNIIPAPVAALSHGVLRIMFVQKLKVSTLAFALAAAILAGGWLLAADPPTDPTPAATQPVAAEPQPAPKAEAPKPLPKGPNKLLVWRKSELILIDPDGKNEKTALKKRLGVHPTGCLLAPDGKQATFYTASPGPPNEPTPATGPSPYILHVIGVDDQKEQSLGVAAFSIAWSPDGTEIAYTEFPTTEKKLTSVHGVINVKTKEKAVLKLPDDHYITDWSRDGKHFVTTRIWPNAGVFLMNRDGTEHKALTEKRLAAGRYGLLGRLSPDGKRLLFSIVTPPKENGKLAKPELAVLDIASGKVMPVVDTPLNGWILSYCWSPDGNRIAYTWYVVQNAGPNDMAVKETDAHLVVCDPDGKNQKTLLSENGVIVPIQGVDWR